MKSPFFMVKESFSSSTAYDLEAIEETLALDIRSPLQKQRHPNPGGGGGSKNKAWLIHRYSTNQ
jgi:hypothetical protein